METTEPARKYESPLREQQAAETRQSILRAVLTLFERESDFDVSMPAVAKEAGVSLRTVYRHFPTKSDLMIGLTEVQNLRSDVFDATTPDELATAVADQFRTMSENEPLFRAMNSSRAGQDARRDARRGRQMIIEQPMRPVSQRLEADDARKLHALVNVLSSSAALFYMQDMWEWSTEDAADAAGWGIAVLADRARRTRHVGLDAD